MWDHFGTIYKYTKSTSIYNIFINDCFLLFMMIPKLIFVVVLSSVMNAQIALPTFQAVHNSNSSLESLSSDSLTFINCGASGRSGPTQSQINSTYTSGHSLYNSVTINTQGIQEWTVPSSGTYTIEAWGAKGGGDAVGGLGARMKGEFSLVQNEVIKIVVGQQGGLAGNDNTSSGGGGTYVIKSPYNSNASILVIAGGGGGSPGSSDYQSGGDDDGQIGTSGSRGYGRTSYSNGGINGNGPSSSSGRASAGAGFFTNGADNGQSSIYGTGGKAFVNGSEGGQDLYSNSGGGVDGGFGGGGSGMVSGYRGSGGGGGYSGGGTGTHNSNTNNHQGGGGGSYNNGSNQDNSSGVGNSHGKVIITY